MSAGRPPAPSIGQVPCGKLAHIVKTEYGSTVTGVGGHLFRFTCQSWLVLTSEFVGFCIKIG